MAVARRDYPTRKAPYEATNGKPVTRHVQSSGGEYIRFFKFYGCDLLLDHKQLVGTCPFPDCQKDSHFYASPGTGLWDCKVCGRSGNVHSFIRTLHETLLVFTTDQQYTDLEGMREGIEWWAFKHFTLVFSQLLQEWLLPAYSIEGKITNLYAWKTIPDAESSTGFKHPVYSGPTLKQLPFGLQFLSKDKSKPLWVCEGHWDTIAWYNLLQRVDKQGVPLIDEHDVIGAPGAGTFPKEYLHMFDGRDVRVLFDNDTAGVQGVTRLVQMIANNNILPAKFGILEWPKEFPKGYDVRDLIAEKPAV